MTACEMLPKINSYVVVRFDDIKVDCRVMDMKQSYGSTRYLVSPLCGDGSIWVTDSRIVETFNDPAR